MATLGDGTSILPCEAEAFLAVITEQDDYIFCQFVLKDLGTHMIMVEDSDMDIGSANELYLDTMITRVG